MYENLDQRASRRNVLEWFEDQSDEDQIAILDSPADRLPDEDADTFLKRVHVRRIVHQTIDRYNNL